jgi:PII-like signaling protein
MRFVIVVREAEKGVSGSFVHRGIIAFIAVLLGL